MPKPLRLTCTILLLSIAGSLHAQSFDALRGNYAEDLAQLYYLEGKYDTAYQLFSYAFLNYSYNRCNPYLSEKYLKCALELDSTPLIKNAVDQLKRSGVDTIKLKKRTNIEEHYHRIYPLFQLSQATSITESVNANYIEELNRLKQIDQSARRTPGNTYEDVILADSQNMISFLRLAEAYGFPTPKLVGYRGMFTVNLLLQHFYLSSTENQHYLDSLLPLQIKLGDFQPHEYAVMMDRKLSFIKDTTILYGTFFQRDANRNLRIKPLQDVKRVDDYRRFLGLGPLLFEMKNNAIGQYPEGYAPRQLSEYYQLLFAHDETFYSFGL